MRAFVSCLGGFATLCRIVRLSPELSRLRWCAAGPLLLQAAHCPRDLLPHRRTRMKTVACASPPNVSDLCITETRHNNSGPQGHGATVMAFSDGGKLPSQIHQKIGSSGPALHSPSRPRGSRAVGLDGGMSVARDLGSIGPTVRARLSS